MGFGNYAARPVVAIHDAEAVYVTPLSDSSIVRERNVDVSSPSFKRKAPSKKKLQL